MAVKDFIIDLGVNVVKDKISGAKEARIVRERLEAFLGRQKKINYHFDLEEEIDFGGLAEYIQTELLEDVKTRLFGNREERATARQVIRNKAILYSQEDKSISRENAVKITEGAVAILLDFYKSKTNRELKFLAAQIEDATEKIVAEQADIVIHSIKASEKRIIEKIETGGKMSVENNLQLLQSGEYGQVEMNLSNYINTLGTGHELYPDYCFGYKSEKGQLYSKPLTQKALEKYPPKISGSGTIQINGQNIQRFDVHTIDYANRHQLPITLNICTARKFLGDVPDPIQHEAERLIGETITIQPEPFPPAFPCSISIDGMVVLDYILLRTEEILDDGTIIISNKEQENCPFKIKMSANLEIGKMTYTFNTVNPTNKEALQYLKVLKQAGRGETISIKVLSLDEEFASGKLGNVDYTTGFDELEHEIEFLEKIVAIENYFRDTISIPKEITEEDVQGTYYLAALLCGGECTGTWSELEFELPLDESLQKGLLEADDSGFTMSYVSKISIALYGKNFELPTIKNFDFAIYDNLDRLKEKAKVLDIGDSIKIKLIPGNKENAVWRERINHKEKV